ncbi:cytochrome P450 9e2-like isoform X2 [Onthophagus taurus]|uniref:cytochrome P450 9e2-like isoform X2 n=1 Tax=Onthophagus taurus TaxID=166361 RepID=UPI0039BDC016
MVFLLIVILIITILYFKISNSHRYWLQRGVNQNDPTFLFGDTTKAFFRYESTYSTLQRLYNSFPDERYIGIYEMTKPILLIRDPELIHQIYFEAFDYFADRRDAMPEADDTVWTKNLAALTGEEWSKTKRFLSSCFNTKNLEETFTLIAECAELYVDHLKKRRPMKLELKDTFIRFSNDVIASIAFGVSQMDSINFRDNEFYQMSKSLSTFTFKQNLVGLAYCICPSLCKKLGLSVLNTETINYFKDVLDENLAERRALNEGGRRRRQDILSFLEEEQRQSRDESVDIAAQAFTFFYFGFDTVSTSLVFLVYELSINTKIQAKLHKEIDETLKMNLGKISYNDLMKMIYLDQVVSGLRKWPPCVGGDRVCTKPYIIQPSKRTECRIELNPGDLVGISIAGIQNDPKYFPRPNAFIPERFSEENKIKIQPNTYLPFGVGPRSCVGAKIALLQIKIFIFHLLAKFHLTPCSKERINVSANCYDLKADGRVWIMLRTRKKN